MSQNLPDKIPEVESLRETSSEQTTIDENSITIFAEKIASEITYLVRQESSFTGPLPSPKTLEGYKNVSPEILELIIANYKDEGSHRREIEKKLPSNGILMSRLGLASAFIIAVSFLATGAALINQGHDVAGASICGAGLLSVVVAFLRHTSFQSKGKK